MPDARPGGAAKGPLSGIRVVEFAGLGPTPFAAMMLADMGAEVIRIDRIGGPAMPAGDGRLAFTNRGRPSVAIDLKAEGGRMVARDLAEQADVLIEGLRPGAMERLGLGPEAVMARNPRLVYGRMTGWGQQGPLAHKAGHDINYIALTGALHMVGPADRPPPPPLNLFGDYGGGALYLVVGILAALVERARSGEGQVIDAAMVDGAASLLTEIMAWQAMGFWTAERGANLLDGGAYFYRCYETCDGGYMAVGAIEPQFHAAFLAGLGLDPAEFEDHMDRSRWADRAARIETVFLTRTRAQWTEAFEPFDACVTPVLTSAEAVAHPANAARRVFSRGAVGGEPQPAPRLSRTAFAVAGPPRLPGEGGREALIRFGFGEAALDALIEAGVLQAG